MKFTDQLRTIDDADLDPYQFRLVMHIWRVGNCWESVRTTAGKCKMSVGKVSQCTTELLEAGLIERVAVEGRMIIRLCSHSEQRSPHEQIQQLNGSNRSPHEQQRSPREQGEKSLPLEKRSPHEPKINEPNEVGKVIDPIILLAAYFTELTALFPKNGSYDDEWSIPLTVLYKKEGNLESAKDKLRRAWEFARNSNGRGKAFTIKSPSSLSTIIANLPEGDSQPGTIKVRTR